MQREKKTQLKTCIKSDDIQLCAREFSNVCQICQVCFDWGTLLSQSVVTFNLQFL